MNKTDKTRRDFIKKSVLTTAGLSTLGAVGFSAKSYGNILGANDRLNIAIAGLGRRLGAFYAPIGRKESNVNLIYLCDVMQSQRERAAKNFQKHIDYQPKLENSILKVIEDPEVDALINAPNTPLNAPKAAAINNIFDKEFVHWRAAAAGAKSRELIKTTPTV